MVWSISEESLRRYVLHASENCIQELLSAADSASDDWKGSTATKGVEVSNCSSGPVHTFRSRHVMKCVSSIQFDAITTAIDAAKLFQEWGGDLLESNHIKGIEENLCIFSLRFRVKSNPFFRNREFILYQRRETMDDGTMVVAVASLPKQIAAGLHPQQCASRSFVFQSGWVLEKLPEDSCIVTFVTQSEYGGWLARWFVKRFNTEMVIVVENFKKQVSRRVLRNEGTPSTNS